MTVTENPTPTPDPKDKPAPPPPPPEVESRWHGRLANVFEALCKRRLTGSEQLAILFVAYLQGGSGRWVAPVEVQTATGLSAKMIEHLLHNLVESGLIQEVDGRFQVPRPLAP